MTTLQEHLQRFDTEKVLLVIIDRDGPSPIHLADTAYYTEPADNIANMPFSPVIAQGGVPRLARRIQEVWGGRSVPTWGPLTLATNLVNGVDLATADIRGKDIQVLLTGPRAIVDWSEAATVLSGVVGVRSGSPDEGITVEVLDRQAVFDDLQLPTSFYDGTESVAFPASNIGRPKPICLGRCRNITPVLIDSANLIYQVNDGAINDILAVYDSGLALTEVAGSPGAGEYSQDLVNGTITLGGSPAGEVTSDVEGMLDGATWLQSTTQIVDWLARAYGDIAPADIDITGLPAETIGIYIANEISVADVITALMQGVIGWWGFTRTNALRARLFQSPTAGGQVFDENRHLSDVKWEEDEDLFWSVPLLYRRNWTTITQPAGAVDLDYGAWLASQGYEARATDTNISTPYPWAKVASQLQTYFDDVAPALAVGNRALAMFGVPRARTKVTVPFTDPPLELGADVELADAGRVSGDHVAVGMVDRWDGEIPLIELEVWG